MGVQHSCTGIHNMKWGSAARREAVDPRNSNAGLGRTQRCGQQARCLCKISLPPRQARFLPLGPVICLDSPAVSFRRFRFYESFWSNRLHRRDGLYRGDKVRSLESVNVWLVQQQSWIPPLYQGWVRWEQLQPIY